MKRTTLKRFCLELLQHLLAAGIMTALAYLLLNSYIAVDSIDGPKVYRIFPIDTGLEFEESEIYHDLFRNAVSDITQLVALKGQLETDGILDPSKKIDVTAYAKEIGKDSGGPLTVVYTLDDIVKWGKSGVEYTNRFMSMSEFVNYFGNCIYPENFKLDQFGQLSFDGFYHVGDAQEDETEEGVAADGADLEEGAVVQAERYGKSAEEITALSQALEESTQEQLEDMVFAHIMSQNPDGIDISREDDGSLTVFIPMLNCRYTSVGGKKQLTAYARNWIEYMKLQENVVAAVESLTINYQRYQLCNEAYRGANSNVKYMVRMMTDDGMCTYTNVPDLAELPDNEVTESFNEYRRYLIYYPDSLVFMGNTIFSEEEIDDYISVYSYAYPDTTHIWLGVDSKYTIQGDSFHTANAVYQKIVPNVGRFIILIGVLALFWLGIGIYLTCVAGMVPGGNGERICYLNRFDKLWTELLLLLAAGLVYGGWLGYGILVDIAETAQVMPTKLFGVELTRLYRYGLFAAFGIYASMGFDMIWYSMVRRMRVGGLWKGSFLHFLYSGIENTVRFILRHKSSMISTLLPYNLFLFSNLAGMAAVYKLWNRRIYAFLLLLAMVAVDGIVGVLLSRRNAEQAEIEEGIGRIRDGEVEFKVDADSLHGSSRELAIAVNNIGEGIRRAVKTSMEDERLKTELITNVSHDLKTPLTSITVLMDNLSQNEEMEKTTRQRFTAEITRQLAGMSWLITALLKLSRLDAGVVEMHRSRFALNSFVEEVLQRLELAAELRQVSFKVAVPEGAFLCADRKWTGEALMNIVKNAVEYSPAGSCVEISGDDNEVYTQIAVRDHGEGITKEEAEKLFRRFYNRNSAREDSMGIGLALAKEVVEKQNGYISVDSGVGGGSMFILRFLKHEA